MPLRQQTIRRKIDKFFAARDSKWEQRTTAITGDSALVVATATPGMINVRLRNGDTIEVYNDVVPDEPDIRVLIGRTKEQPDLWKVIARRESYSIPQAPRIKHHHKQHEFIDGDPGPDTTWIGPKQIMSLTVFVLDEVDAQDFIVTVIGDVIEIPTGLAEVQSQELDLSSYVPTTGARYVTLQFDEDGALSVVSGTPVDSPELLTLAAVPPADTDKYGFAYVMLHEGQEELLNKHIRVFRKFFGGGGSSITIPYGNLTGNISDQTDLQAALDAKADVGHEHEGGNALVPVTEDVEVEFCRFDVDGALAVVADASISVLVTRYITLGRPHTYAKNNGTSSSTIIDVNVNGSTIYTTSGNRPTLAHDETYDIAALPDTVDLVPGDVLTIDIDQIAGGTPEGLSVILTEIVHDLVFDGSEIVVEEP